jgi:hypothetical protein
VDKTQEILDELKEHRFNTLLRVIKNKEPFDKKKVYFFIVRNNIPKSQSLRLSLLKKIDSTTFIRDISNELKSRSKQFPNKKLKLGGSTMEFPALLELFRKAIEYKRKHLKEEKDIEPAKKKEVSIKDKKAQLKKIYREVLISTPYWESIPVFMDLIDQSPESYIDYELNINMKDALGIVDELISGKGDLTPKEMGNLANIISGVGIPAIEQYASKGKKLPKGTGKFGADAINKNSKEFLASLKQRRDPKYQLTAPETKDVVKTTQEKGVARRDFLDTIKKDLVINLDKDSSFYKTASRLKSKGINIERLVRSMMGAEKYSEAKEKASVELKRQGKSIEDLRGTDDLYNLFFGLKKEKEKVKK